MSTEGTESSHHEPTVLEDLRDAWPVLAAYERVEGFLMLTPAQAEEMFNSLDTKDQLTILRGLTPSERRIWLRVLAPDDAADIIQAAREEERNPLLELLDDATRKEVTALMAYHEDAAGGLMSPRFARVRPDMSVDEAISYLRRQARAHIETIYYTYVLDAQQRLLGIISFRELFAAQSERKVSDVMRTDVVTVAEDMDQEALSRLFAQKDVLALPVVDAQGRMKGIVTVDDIVDVVQEEATEDIQKLGGMQALEAPYLESGLGSMIKKRGGWLSILLLGEMLTATAMGHFEEEIARSVVLTLFIPLIISSGGNSGSQASTLVIRAMALDEVRLRDWWRVMRREVLSGLALGSILGVIGTLRILLWQKLFNAYGEHSLALALTVGTSLVGVVLFGTLAGSMLPFILRRFGLDPASASAPFVATLVDVSGVLVYFSVASILMQGAMS